MNANEAIGKIRFMLDVGGSDGFTSADKEALNMAINALSAEITAPPKSNGDRIRKMTDEELAEWLLGEANYSCNICTRQNEKSSCYSFNCEEYIEKWLKQEVSEDADN